ncbi:MAG: hypothetical protein QG602_3998 [Verrucomicrobiota bacterium]|nr:hypothetical protein [Verrucomicrobiota bacterium]
MKKLPLFTLCLALGSGLAARADDVPAGAKIPEPDHYVYLSFLPEPAELMADAKANGLEVLRLDHTADRVVVTYKYPDGHTATLGYAKLGSVRASDRVVARVQPPSSAVYTSGDTTTVVVKDDPEIIYVEREPRTRVVYREREDFWLPLTLGLGIGYVTGHHSHGHYWRGHSHYRGYRSYRGHR